MLRGIFSPNDLSNAFFASRDVNSVAPILLIIVLARRSNFRGEKARAFAVACGLPDNTSARSRILPIFSRVTGPSIVIECFTPSAS
ncbi:hypothetical protein E6H36_03635 [Candidatus Bathyarchaeota archaeon]|nr:MAG: hypothetical protein E6H36_03635 [Candidatus Bathyarchaeota archaeon]